ncbi:MAG: hypothetical protein ACLPTZ_07635 [Beijerinckiaceae bacterium]
MIHQFNSRLIELPDRKEITLCEAVTAFVYGKAYDVRQLDRDGLKEKIAEEKDLLEHLQRAAYAGRVKFRAIKEFGEPADGYKDIDPLYFYINPLFNWAQDVIVSSKPWYFVHLDREQFVSLLRDMGVSVQQGPDVDALGKQTTYATGAQGRPSSKHLVLPMAQRKLDDGYRPKNLTAFAGELAKELRIAHPKAAPMTAKTIANVIRELWRAYPKLPKKVGDPS